MLRKNSFLSTLSSFVSFCYSHFLQKTKRQESNGDAATERTSCYGIAGDSLTCVINEQSLTLYEMLGNGAFGYVRRGKWLKDSRKKVIINFRISAPFNNKQTLNFYTQLTAVCVHVFIVVTSIDQ